METTMNRKIWGLAILLLAACGTQGVPPPAPVPAQVTCRASDAACMGSVKVWCYVAGQQLDSPDPWMVPCPPPFAGETLPAWTSGQRVRMRLYYFFTGHWRAAFDFR